MHLSKLPPPPKPHVVYFDTNVQCITTCLRSGPPLPIITSNKVGYPLNSIIILHDPHVKLYSQDKITDEK